MADAAPSRADFAFSSIPASGIVPARCTLGRCRLRLAGPSPHLVPAQPRVLARPGCLLPEAERLHITALARVVRPYAEAT
jgi:hypothetical protein